jgi:hypothetical protein
VRQGLVPGMSRPRLSAVQARLRLDQP